MVHAPFRPPLVPPRGALLPQQLRRRALGHQGNAPGILGGRLRGPALPRAAHELQAHRPVPGAGGELGLHRGKNPRRRTPGAPAEPVRLYGRRHGRRRRRRSRGLPCGRGKGHGGLGQRERRPQRHLQRPLDRGRLRQIRRAGDPARPEL